MRICLQLNFKLLQLSELQSPLQVLHLSLFQRHITLEILDSFPVVSVLLKELVGLLASDSACAAIVAYVTETPL